jgi:hypothetical protein
MSTPVQPGRFGVGSERSPIGFHRCPVPVKQEKYKHLRGRTNLPYLVAIQAVNKLVFCAIAQSKVRKEQDGTRARVYGKSPSLFSRSLYGMAS